MAFKLGNKPLPGIARKGNINKKHGFIVERAKLGDGILGEAHPGRVVIDESIEEGSAEEKRVISHEGQHVKDMDSGKAAFGDDWVRWEGKRYHRKDGQIKYNGKWNDEGWEGFPWEKSAMKAESPLKMPGHYNPEKVHHHKPDGTPSLYGHENANAPASKKVDEGAKEGDASLESAKNASPEQQQNLLNIINRARKEQGLQPAKTVEEGLKTTPTFD
tara:strand:- start:285 stop:935 length:651 start_codon:yes stop_codon:yes gene_type:complete